MTRKSTLDRVCEVLADGKYLESSRIKDRLFELMGGGTPSIRELNAVLKNKKFVSVLAPAGKTQVKKYALRKKPPKKN